MTTFEIQQFMQPVKKSNKISLLKMVFYLDKDKAKFEKILIFYLAKL